jgi:hypothetical protein
MSGAKAKVVSEINLEEFERRLRAAHSQQSGIEDPLAELTRLVDRISSERAPDEKVIGFAAPRLPKVQKFRPAAESAPEVEPPPVELPALDPPLTAKSTVEALLPVPVPPPAPVTEEPPLLRPTIEEADFSEPGASDDEFADSGSESVQPIQAERPRRQALWYAKLGGLTALGLLMVGGAVAMKVGVPGRAKAPPMIMAANGPSKVAPPSESTVQAPGDSGALLMKDSATPAPVKIVTNEEQPVDLSARMAAPSPVAPSTDTPILAPFDSVAAVPSASPSPSPSLASGASSVKTVSVRPDGSLISADSTPVAPRPTPTPSPVVKKPDPVAAAPLAATPTLDLPAKPAAKSSARVAIAKTDTTVPADSASAPTQQSGSAAHADKPVKPPTKLRPPAVVADLPAAASAPAAQTAPIPHTGVGGDWAVQLAAPRSEGEAQSAISRLKSKYADALGDASLGVHKAESRGETIYRVRAGGYSKADAAALCAKLKAAGGDCFIAKN